MDASFGILWIAGIIGSLLGMILWRVLKKRKNRY